MDERVLPGALVIGFLLLMLGLMYWGWRRRQRRQATTPRPLTVPEGIGSAFYELDVLYVASTVAGEPLNRIAVSGLGFRARAHVEVLDEGVILGLAGEPDAFIPAAHITTVDRATWTIDRVVERDGLVRIAWLLGEQSIDSYLRVTEPADPSALIDAIRRIVPAPTLRSGQADGTEKE